MNESNRQQALFPKNAEILHNPNGTAAGSKLYIDNKIIFMLPGPPNECIPMFEQYIVPSLINESFVNNHQLLYWKLIGVIEADLADKIDTLIKDYNVVTSYRWNYPYLDLKVSYNITDLGINLFDLIHKEIQTNVVSTNNINSLDLLRTYLNIYDCNIYIKDNLTKGEFRKFYGEHKQLHYNQEPESPKNCLFVTSYGLEEFYNNKPFISTTDLYCTMRINDTTLFEKLTIPYRGPEVVKYAVHFMGYCMCKMFKKLGLSHE